MRKVESRSAGARAHLARAAGILGAAFLFASLSGWQGETREPLAKITGYDSSADLADPVQELAKDVARGRVHLSYDSKTGYLLSVLKHLNAPVSSKALVFSKTSEQIDLIGPKTPRAIYIADDVYVGFVQGSKHLEFAAADPKKGAVFYTLSQEPSERPKFERATNCIRCHISPKTFDVPGFLVRSVKASPEGQPLSQITQFVSGHSSPMNERWGGWYVTGTMEGDVHLGNSFLTDFRHPEAFDPKPGSRVTDLHDRFDATKYASPHSDVVALLVLDHSVKMHDLIAHAAYETMFAQADRKAARESGGKLKDWSGQRIGAAADLLVSYMLFRDEAPLKGQVKGTSGFAEEFEKLGPRDRKGRSLREFDLKRRLFRYPCSYLIYSASFDGLPNEVKEAVWARLRRGLGQGRGAYGHMSAQDREAVLEILLDTKPDFRRWVARHRPESD
ncbi:MAG: hypothetical protein HYR64_04315 [Fimbriimonas ginsengisoli]|uniref:Cytochrome c domain-containing protein n=1 Tax=Fimbriimonas ginsengisoli TaxID=1005039 RepID=A0A931PVI8_FIMGI|nr:hypothetical protein [Fimbriimonas ginsengisoli]